MPFPRFFVNPDMEKVPLKYIVILIVPVHSKRPLLKELRPVIWLLHCHRFHYRHGFVLSCLERPSAWTLLVHDLGRAGKKSTLLLSYMSQCSLLSIGCLTESSAMGMPNLQRPPNVQALGHLLQFLFEYIYRQLVLKVFQLHAFSPPFTIPSIGIPTLSAAIFGFSPLLEGFEHEVTGVPESIDRFLEGFHVPVHMRFVHGHFISGV